MLSLTSPDPSNLACHVLRIYLSQVDDKSAKAPEDTAPSPVTETRWRVLLTGMFQMFVRMPLLVYPHIFPVTERMLTLIVRVEICTVV